MIGIYKITSPSGRIYIGQSRNINSRFKRYYKLKNCQNQVKLYNSFLKYTPQLHKFEIIEECNLEDLNCRERHWQDHYNVLNGGLNHILTSCQDKVRVVSQATKDKQSKSMTGKLAGSKHPMFGKRHSEEFRNNRSGENNVRFGIKGQMHPSFGIPNKARSKILLDKEMGIFYDSIKEASKALGINYGTLKNWLSRRVKDNKTNLIYV